MKVCARCGIGKDESSFGKRTAAPDGLHPYCKPCHRESSRKTYHKDVEKSRAKDRARYLRRKEYCSEQNKRWREENTERHSENSRKWAQKNRKRVMARKKERYHEKYRTDPVFRLDRVVRRHVRRAIELRGTEKRFKTMEVLQYSPSDLARHIESQFVEGMSWDNYGDWHIDHIKPIKAFVDEGVTDPSVIHALDNLGPLWAADNISKGASYGG